jgi:hypothetical protein
VVINIVNYAIVQQASLASTEYPKGVNEFVKAGLTEVPSVIVKPPRVKESPASLECMVKQIIPLGEEGGAGNLVVCEVLLVHVKKEILNESNKVDPQKLDAVARMGEDWYCRAQGDALFKVPKPLMKLGIGIDRIPQSIRKSTVFTGNDLGMLGNVEQLPDDQSVGEFSKNNFVQAALKDGEKAVHQLAQEFIRKGDLKEAWIILLAKRNI